MRQGEDPDNLLRFTQWKGFDEVPEVRQESAARSAAEGTHDEDADLAARRERDGRIGTVGQRASLFLRSTRLQVTQVGDPGQQRPADRRVVGIHHEGQAPDHADVARTALGVLQTPEGVHVRPFL